MITGKLSTEFADRLNRIEKHIFGETTDEAIVRTKDADEFSVANRAMQGTAIYRYMSPAGMYYDCSRCHRPLLLNKDGKFETDTSRTTTTQLINWGIAPVEDLCDHKRDPKQPGSKTVFRYNRDTDSFDKVVV